VVADIEGLETPHGQQQSQILLLAPHQDGPSKVGDIVTPPGPWTTTGPLSHVSSQQDFPRYSFLGHSEHMAEPTWLKSFYSEKSDSTFSAVQI